MRGRWTLPDAWRGGREAGGPGGPGHDAVPARSPAPGGLRALFLSYFI